MKNKTDLRINLEQASCGGDREGWMAVISTLRIEVKFEQNKQQYNEVRQAHVCK